MKTRSPSVTGSAHRRPTTGMDLTACLLDLPILQVQDIQIAIGVHSEKRILHNQGGATQWSCAPLKTQASTGAFVSGSMFAGLMAIRL
jgi:hypothetical protein